MPASRHAWILDGPRDLLLLVGTPLLILPLVALAQATWSDVAIAAFVLAFGATGHHLPGLLRAYGDRDLFERFRARLVLGPVLLFIACLFFYVFSFQGLVTMIVLWGTWHALAQVYGFGRIYDAKVGAFDARTAQLDKALCIVWFVLPLLTSPWRLGGLLQDAYASGLPVVTAANLATAQAGWWWATAAITTLWLANFVKRWRRGEPANAVKAVLFVSSFAFWYYALTGAGHAVVGLAMFEIFHDVQYLTIVWLYNRRRVAQPGAHVAKVLRWLFRPGVALIPIYVGAVFAYGGLDFVRQRLSLGELAPILSGLFAMSGFLHYYLDSFIWNLRDASTREGLAVAGAGPAPTLAQSAGRWLPQVSNWALFAVPLLVLVIGQVAMPRSPLAVTQAVARSLPDSAAAWVALADAQQDAGRTGRALATLQHATLVNPRYQDAWASLATLAEASGHPALEREALERLLELDPNSTGARDRLAANLEARTRPRRAGGRLEPAPQPAPDSAASDPYGASR